jgi:hypothetical protein
MVVKNGKAPARRKSASSSAKSSRSNTVSKGGVHSQHITNADELDGDIDHNQTTAVESEAGDRVLEETGIDGRASGDGVSTESTELTAITFHQSELKVGDRVTDGTQFATISIVSKADIYLDRDNGGSVCFPATELETFGWKLCDAWNPAEFGELHHVAESDGQLNLLDWLEKEPPEPDDYESIELFDQAYGKWEDSQQSTVNSQQLTVNSQEELCNTLMDGSICAAELAQDFLILESNCGEDSLTNSVKKTTIAATFSSLDIPHQEESLQMSTTLTMTEKQTSLLPALPVSPSQLTESDLQQLTIETASQQSLQQSEITSPNLPLSKTSSASSTAHIPPATNQEATLPTSSTPYRQVGMMRNGFVSGVMNSPLRGVGKDYLLLRSPGALSSTGAKSPPGKTRLESQLQELNLISAQEVVAPEFLESGYQLPVGFTNLQENRTALELAQAQSQALQPQALQQSIAPKSELPVETAITAIDAQPSATLWTGESQQLDSSELTISQDLIESWTEWEKNNFLWLFEFDFCMHKGELKKIQKFLPGTKTIRLEGMQIGSAYLQMWEVEPPRFVENKPDALEISLPSNIGALTKVELISMAQKQHKLICVIERKEFELAIEKLHRVRLTGVYLQEFKKKCQYGEFENQLEQAGIGVRSAQQYMVIAKNWEIVEAKAKLVALLAEENQPAIGLKWALETVRDEKKQLKSAAPPKDPDGWRTPNTKDQPVVDLVKQSLGGIIWVDPCSDPSAKVPASVRYFKDDDGLAECNAWTRTVFANPPFSDPLPWVKRCCFEIARGTVSAAVMLLKAGVVSNVGTGELISKYASAVCHWRGRINFLNDEGYAVKGSDFDCVLVYFGDRLDLFRKAFSGRGTISTIDNHYSSVNKKYQLESESFATVAAEERQMAAAVGLRNGRSLLPDMRDADRDLMERHDPSTVFENMPTVFTSIEQPKISTEIESISAEFQQAKSDCLNDYITAISSNMSAFSDEQVAFLAKIINEESAKRIGY